MQRLAPHVVAALAATERIRIRLIRIHPTPRRRAPAAAGSGGGGSGSSEGRAGREQVRPWYIRLPRCGHSRQSARPSRSERPCLTFGTSFSATRGTTEAGPPRNYNDLLESRGVKVWFSEKDVGLGVPLLREIDKGLANSRVGIVLVTPALLRRLPARGHRRQRTFGAPRA